MAAEDRRAGQVGWGFKAIDAVRSGALGGFRLSQDQDQGQDQGSALPAAIVTVGASTILQPLHIVLLSVAQPQTLNLPCSPFFLIFLFLFILVS